MIKKITAVIMLAAFVLFAAVPDWTGTDLDGNQHNLYSYLNQGKIVCLSYMFTS